MANSKSFKRNILIFIILMAVIASLLLVFRDTSPFGKKNTLFAIAAGREITSILLSDKQKDLTLEKEGDKWLLNGQKETRKSSISFITSLLQDLEIKSPVSPDIFKAEITDKGIKPVRVRVYDKRILLNEFLVYKTRSNVYGNIMKKKNGSKPFIVHVPGHDGDIGSAFTLNELYWQPYTIFNLLPSEISSVKIENPDPENSFTIIHRNNRIVLSDGVNVMTGIDSVLVMRYISYFTYIPFETWALELSDEQQKEIISHEPSFKISVVTSAGNPIILTLWERKTEDGSLDTDRLYGKVEDKEQLFIVRYFDLDPILKKKDYFFE